MLLPVTSPNNPLMKVAKMFSEESLYSNLSQCLGALKHVKESYVKAHALIKMELQMVEDKLTHCIQICQNFDQNTTTYYGYCLSILFDLDRSYHKHLTKYFNISPYWQYYITNMQEILGELAICCRQLNEKERQKVFNRKFKPLLEVMRGKYSGQGGRFSWIENALTETATAKTIVLV